MCVHTACKCDTMLLLRSREHMHRDPCSPTRTMEGVLRPQTGCRLGAEVDYLNKQPKNTLLFTRESTLSNPHILSGCFQKDHKGLMSNLPLRPQTTRQLKFCMRVSVSLSVDRCVFHVQSVTCEHEVCL